MEAEEAEEKEKMYGLMRAKENKEVEKDLVSRETQPSQAGLACHHSQFGEINYL